MLHTYTYASYPTHTYTTTDNCNHVTDKRGMQNNSTIT